MYLVWVNLPSPPSSRAPPTRSDGMSLSLIIIKKLKLILFNRWLFEKYDGIRGFWNPKERVFYSRHGNVLRMPPEIINEMPDSMMMLDGEIWYTFS